MNRQASNPVIPFVLDQHAEEAAFLWLLRDKAVREPHYLLSDLCSIDRRIEAHLDGLRLAGDAGWDLCMAALETEEPGEVFAAAVLALEGQDGGRLAKVLDVAARSKAAFRGLISAFGWLSKPAADQWLSSMTRSPSTLYIRVALAGLAVRRETIDSDVLARALSGDDLVLRSRALRAIGEHKRRDLLADLHTHANADDENCRFWAAWSGALLGDAASAARLKPFVGVEDQNAQRAIELAPRLLDPADAQKWLRHLAQFPGTLRFALIGAGATGDPLYAGTLIKQMVVPEQARIAADAFSMITGVDLSDGGMQLGNPPEGFHAGPTEDPADDDVSVDEDENLPWPNPSLIQRWWGQHGGRFRQGTRYLCGVPISTESCRRVLAEGTQRQRIAASFELARLEPDEPLFEWRAPGLLQERRLGLRR